MIDSSDTIDGTTVCGMCGDHVGAERYAQEDDWSLYVFCSEKCVRAATREQRKNRWAARRRLTIRFAMIAVFVGAFLAPHQGPPGTSNVHRLTPAAAPPVDADTGIAPLPPGWFGPDWPPNELNMLAALGRDAWIHPLSGPFRRMPRSDSRVFGAERPGDRAVECRNGHCGVDLGGEIWGEHIHAVHEGVVDFVQRGLNPDHGGRFVRISHRNGTLFTWYFHLAAIPRAIERGKVVKGGDVVGLLGDTGVKESAPHLHFALSIRPFKDGPEKYIDPEPLIALWPLRVPVDGSEVGLVTTLAEPAVPLGSALLTLAHKRKVAKRKRAPAETLEGGSSGPDNSETGPTQEDEDSASERTAPDPTMPSLEE